MNRKSVIARKPKGLTRQSMQHGLPRRLCLLAMTSMVRCYQWFISPLMPASCRFHPTCSAYASQSLRVHGVFKGTWLTLKRLARCHPWGGQGVDPVPEAKTIRGIHAE